MIRMVEVQGCREEFIKLAMQQKDLDLEIKRLSLMKFKEKYFDKIQNGIIQAEKEYKKFHWESWNWQIGVLKTFNLFENRTTFTDGRFSWYSTSEKNLPTTERRARCLRPNSQKKIPDHFEIFKRHIKSHPKKIRTTSIGSHLHRWDSTSRLSHPTFTCTEVQGSTCEKQTPIDSRKFSYTFEFNFATR